MKRALFLIIVFLAAFFVLSVLLTDIPRPLLLPCLPAIAVPSGVAYSPPGVAALAEAVVHYATSTSVPQQSLAEISLSLSVLRRHAPLRLLVFGLGRDSRLWHALNVGGATVFLEEDPAWLRAVRAQAPLLRGHLVHYRTRLDDADRLLAAYRAIPACLPGNASASSMRLKGNSACPLALHNLPAEVYETEWDMIMIDAPKGYFGTAPGRMAAIFSAAAMARERRGEGNTEVFLHDVDRRVERVFAEEFLCAKYRVGAVGRLWHFSIPPVTRCDAAVDGIRKRPFC